MKDLTKGKERNLILKFALPMLLGSVFQQLYNIVDSIIVGHYIGKDALSAVGASFPVFYALISLVIGLGSGAGIVISQYYGAKQNDKVQIAVDTMYIFMFVSSLIITFFGIIFIKDIFLLLKLPPEIMKDAELYLTITLGGLIIAFGYNGTASIFRSLGDSKRPLYFMIISTVTNIILDLLFVIYFKWGIAGVAIATVISQAGAFASAVIYINRNHKILKIRFLHLKFDKDIMFKSFRIGIPSGLQQLFVALGMTAILAIVNGFGTSVIAAYTVAGRIDFFAIMPAMIFAQALTSFTGQNMGAGKIDRVKKGFRSVMIMSITVSVVLSIIVITGSRILMKLFTPDEDVITEGMHYLRIVAPSYVLFAIMFSFTGVFRGAGDTLIPMFITLFSLWIIRVPFAYYLSADYGTTGIWYSIPLAWSSGLLFSLIYYFTGRWKRKAVVKIPLTNY